MSNHAKILSLNDASHIGLALVYKTIIISWWKRCDSVNYSILRFPLSTFFALHTFVSTLPRNEKVITIYT